MKISNKPIVLVGMTGSGKSRIGRDIAKKLNKVFFDLDKEIEKHVNLNVNEIFNNFGEFFFRKKEYEILYKIIKKKGTLISLGGGTNCQKNCNELVNSSSISIWIDTNINVIYKRLNGKSNRPLLKGLTHSSLKRKLIEIYSERYKYYKNANLRVKLSDNSLAQSVAITIRKYEDYLIRK